MKKISLNDTLGLAYKVVEPEVISIKSSVMSICSDIDRYFQLRFNLNISQVILNETDYLYLIKLYPQLSGLSIENFVKLLEIFSEIREINAHLFICRDVAIDAELNKYLDDIVEHKYLISKNGKITMYGQAYILSLIAQKYNLWPFYTSYFTKDQFLEFYKTPGVVISKIQTEEQHKMQNYCGLGKPINNANITNHELIYLNNTLKLNLTNIVFNLEKECIHTKKTNTNFISFSQVLNCSYIFDSSYEEMRLMVFLRNCWFHGVMLEENANFDDVPQVFSFNFIVESLIKIKKTLSKNYIMFGKTICSIEQLGKDILNYYALRMVELSYKILDSRLLTTEKVDSRIEAIKKSFDCFIQSSDRYNLTRLLIDNDEIEFTVKNAKFTDKVLRTTILKDLQIVKLHSNNGFQIGEFYTTNSDLCLVLIDLEERYQNKINDKYLYEYINESSIKCYENIVIYEYDCLSN